MFYLYSAIIAVLFSSVAFVILNKESCDKIRIFNLLSSNNDSFESKEIPFKQRIVISIAAGLLCGVGSWFAFTNSTNIINTVKSIITLLCLLCAAGIDYREHRIPNVIPLTLLVSAIILLLAGYLFRIDGAMSYVISSVFAVIAVVLFMVIASLLTKHGIGMGDIKLLGAFALMCGVPGVCGSLLVAMIACGIVAIILLIFKKTTIKGALPFAPFIFLGYIVTLIFLVY